MLQVSHSSRMIIVAMAAIFAAGWIPGRCEGQVLPLAPQDMRSRLSSARDAVAMGRFFDGVRLLEPLLADARDGFIRADGSGKPQRTVKAEAAALLASLPPEGF